MQDSSDPPRLPVAGATEPSPGPRLVFLMGVDGRAGLARSLFACTLVLSVALCLGAPVMALGTPAFGALALVGSVSFAVVGIGGIPFGALALVTGETVIDIAAGTIVQRHRFAGFPLATKTRTPIDTPWHLEIRDQGSVRYPRYSLFVSGDSLPIASFSREVDAREQAERIVRALER